MRVDLIRVERARGGFVVYSRPEGQTPRSYAYADRAVAKTVEEVLEIVEELLRG